MGNDKEEIMNKAIKKIELDLGGKTISLTPQQAKNLKDALDDLFGKEIIKVIEKEYIRDSYPLPYPLPQPYPIYPRRPYWEWEPHYLTGTTANIDGAGNYSFDNDILRLTG